MAKLTPTQVTAAMKHVSKWKRKGAEIHRQFKFKDFTGSMKFVTAVAKAANQADHHPDIDIRWNEVKLALSTHSEGGLTEKDFAMAKKFDGLA